MRIKTLTVGTLALATFVGIAPLTAFQRPASGAPQAAQKPAQKDDGQTGRGDRGNARKPWYWWTDDASKKELGLTEEQAKTIGQIYMSSKDELAGYREGMMREQKELDRLIDESKAEQWVVLRQIEKVETQRSSYNKLWIMTLYRMHRQLTPDQRVKLQALLERVRRDARDGRGGRNPDARR